ncbi:MAG: hypothetical protein GY929_19625 [Actinomycetia bacterium]|nr:hypothetical protein [Actinomycetes bacterium]
MTADLHTWIDRLEAVQPEWVAYAAATLSALIVITLITSDIRRQHPRPPTATSTYDDWRHKP